MFKRIKILLVLITLSITVCLISSTYSRYVADMTGNVDMIFAKWQILVSDTDITNGTNSSISFTPVIEPNNNVATNTIAPSSKGYFDISIDPTNVDVSFNYSINLSVANQNMPDLKITKYAVIPEIYTEGYIFPTTDITDNIVTNSIYYDNTITDFQFQPFTVRVYFEWYEGANEEMNDTMDTIAATSNDTITINANITFEQII